MTVIDLASVIGQQTLNLLEETSQSFGIPGLGGSARVCLRILRLVIPNSGRHRRDFVSIGKDACVITANIIHRVNLDGDFSSSLNHAILEQDSWSLLREMEGIEQTIGEYQNRGSFMKFVSPSKVDIEIIQKCRRRIENALKLFHLQSDMDIRQQLSLLEDKLQQLANIQNQSQAPQAPQMPHSPSSNSQVPSWPEPSIPSYNPPSSFPQSTSSPWGSSSTSQQPASGAWTYPSAPPPAPPQSDRAQSREERRSARHARREMRVAQQAMNVPTGFHGVPTDSTFANVQNHITPGGDVTYSYVNGNVFNSNRDDSFKVSGSGNKVDISFIRR